ncbi:MAG: 50S ribosomal protein L1 [Planctomycetota bacterium]|nr:MAG: 50S ribosomal protein L1 [Planctomycetota bacterium]
MVTMSKRHTGNVAKIDKDKVYSVEEALVLLRAASPAKFDETVEVAINLGIDPKKSDQAVRGAVSLPHGTGKTKRVIAFVKDPAKQEEARAAGAVEVGDDDLVKRVSDGWTDFDVAVSAPDMMGKVGRLGRVLGPQGKMPTPKSGTVTPNVAKAVAEFSAGKVEFRADAGATVHAPLGRRSFDDQKLTENLQAFLSAVTSMKPPASKGTYLKSVHLTTTMGPGVAVDASR